MKRTRRVFEQEIAEEAEKGFLHSALSACFCLFLFLLFASHVSPAREVPTAGQTKLVEVRW